MRRVSEHDQIAAALPTAPGLSVIDVHGPGGVGKTWLVRQVLDELCPPGSGWLTLRVDAASGRDDLVRLLGALFPPSLPPPAPPHVDRFPHVRRALTERQRLIDRARADLEAHTGAAPEVRAAALATLHLGRRLNALTPASRDALDLNAVDDASMLRTLDDAADLLRSLRSLRDARWLPGPIQSALGRSLAARVRDDLHGALTDAAMIDLEAALVGTTSRPWWTLTEPRLAGVSGLLVVLDDWEAVGPALQPWVLERWLARLAAAAWPTALVIVGRDPLLATDPGWQQHAARHLAASVGLAPFTRDEAEAWMDERGVSPDRRDALWQATRGFPYLLDAMADGEPESTLSLRMFHDRVTRWMSPTEQRWLDEVIHLDVVDGDTLRLVLPPEEADRALAWFEHEASVRDPDAPVWRVRPLIREKLLALQRVRHPSRFAERQARVR